MPVDQKTVALVLIGGIGIYFLMKQKKKEEKIIMENYNFDFSSIPDNFGELLNNVDYGNKPIIIPM